MKSDRKVFFCSQAMFIIFVALQNYLERLSHAHSHDIYNHFATMDLSLGNMQVR